MLPSDFWDLALSLLFLTHEVENNPVIRSFSDGYVSRTSFPFSYSHSFNNSYLYGGKRSQSEYLNFIDNEEYCIVLISNE